MYNYIGSILFDTPYVHGNHNFNFICANSEMTSRQIKEHVESLYGVTLTDTYTVKLDSKLPMADLGATEYVFGSKA